MQFQADICRCPVVRPRVLETTALGAAYLAGLAIGYWKDVDELKEQWSLDNILVPKCMKKWLRSCLPNGIKRSVGA